MKKSNVFIQNEAYSCGACCIESVVSYYGGYVPHETVLIDTLTNTNGTNAYNMIRALIKYGFSSQGKKENICRLNEMKLPVIAHTVENGFEHFVVIYKIKKNYLVVMNPRVGYKRYNIEEFSKIYDEIIITVTPNSKIVKYENNFGPIELCRSLFKNKLKILGSVLVFNIVYISLSLASSVYLKVLEKTTHVFYVLLMFIGFILFKYFIFTIKTLIQKKIDIRISEASNKELTSKIFKSDYRYIMNKRGGELLKKVNDLAIINDVLLRLFTDGIMDIILLIGSLICLFFLSTQLAICVGLSICAQSALFVLFNRHIYAREVNYNDARNTYHGDFIEYSSHIETIKNIHKEKHFINILENSFKSQSKCCYKLERLHLSFEVIKSILFDLSYLFILTIGIISVKNGILSLADLFVFSAIYSLINSSSLDIMNNIYEYLNVRVLIRDTCEFFNIETSYLKTIDMPFQLLEVRNLSLSYDKRKNVIDNFNYTIERGDKLLIMGPSGIGKSSLAMCISGLIRDYSGEIVINGSTNIRYKRLVYIGQKESLFTGTVRNNILLDSECEKKIDVICKACELKDNAFLDKHIINSGENISKGEKARIILARALYQNPEVLIIDELLSNISETLENKILYNLLKQSDLTLIYITHRDKQKMFKKQIILGKE